MDFREKEKILLQWMELINEKTRIIISDEISFMSTRQIIKLHTNLQKACANYTKMLGGLNIGFTGDFSLYEPKIKSKRLL